MTTFSRASRAGGALLIALVTAREGYAEQPQPPPQPPIGPTRPTVPLVPLRPLRPARPPVAEPAGVDWAAVASALSGTPPRSAGALASELLSPTSPALKQWSAEGRARHARDLELVVLDPTKELAPRLGAERLSFKNLQSPRAAESSRASIVALKLGQNVEASLLKQLDRAAQLAAKYRSLADADVPVSALPGISAALLPKTPADVLAAAGLSPAERARASSIRTLNDLAEIDVDRSASAWGIDRGRLEAARDLARGSLSDPTVGRPEAARRQLSGATSALGLTPAAQSALSGAGVTTLRDVLSPAVQNRLSSLPQLDDRQRGLLRSAGRLAALSPNGDVVGRLARSFSNVRDVARAPRETVKAAIGASASDADVERITTTAASLDAVVGQQIVSSAVNGAPANRVAATYGNAARLGLIDPALDLTVSPSGRVLIGNALPDACTACVASESAVSLAAYLIDLLDFIQDDFQITLNTLESRMRQDLASMTLDRNATSVDHPHARLANEALVRFILERRGQPWRAASTAAVDGIYTEFRALPATSPLVPDAVDRTFRAYLQEIGTDRDTVQRVVQGAAGVPAPPAYAASLGLAVADLTTLARPAAQVRLSDLDSAAALLRKGKAARLVATLRTNMRAQEFGSRRDRLVGALDRGAADFPARAAAAETQAATEADSALAAGARALQHEADGDAATAAAATRARLESSLLPSATANLVHIALAAARQNPVRNAQNAVRTLDDTQALGNYLFVDLQADPKRETSRVAFAVETLQTFVLASRLGRETDYRAPSFDDTRWQWTRSYGVWKAAMTVFLYPENFLFPGIRSDPTPSFQRMAEAFESGPPSRARAQDALDGFANELRELAGSGLRTAPTGDIIGAAQSGDKSYFFIQGRFHGGLWYSTVDRDGAWTGWRLLELLKDARFYVRHIVAVGGKVYVLYYQPDDDSTKALTQGADGQFTEVIDVGKALSVIAVTPVENYEGGFLELVVDPHDGVIDPLKPEFADWLARLNGIRSAYNFSAADDRWFSARRVYKRLRLVARRKQIVPGGSSEEDALVFVPKSEELVALAEHQYQLYFVTQEFVSGAYTLRIRAQELSPPHPLFVGEQRTGRAALPVFEALIGPSLHSGTTWFQSLDAKPTGSGPLNDVLMLVFQQESDLEALFFNRNLEPPALRRAPAGTARYSSLHRFDDKILMTRASELVEYPWADDLAGNRAFWPGNFPEIGQLLLPAENAALPLRADLSALRSEEGRRVYKQLQEEVFGFFHSNGMARRYLEELFLHAPLYLASKLNEAGRHEHAADVYAAVFQPFAKPGECRFLYEGEELCPDPAQPPAPTDFNARNGEAYLRNPFDPHGLARVRPSAYARYALFNSVGNLLDWADAEFVRDTRESVARARELYETGSAVLGLPDLPRDLCASGNSELLVSLFRGTGPAATTTGPWTSLLADTTVELRDRGTARIATGTRADVIRILQGPGDECAKRAQVVAILDGLKAGPPRASRTVGGVMAASNRAQVAAVYDTAEDLVLARTAGPSATFGGGISPRMGRPLVPELFERGFCVPPSGTSDVLRFRIEAALEKIRTGRNFAGISRAIQTESVDVDPVAVVRARAGGSDDLDGVIPSEPPPLFRYSYLRERARYLTTIAQQLEASFVAAADKAAAQEYTLLQARNDLKLKREQVSLEGLRVRESQQRLGLAGLQRGRAEFSEDHFARLLTQGESDFENLALTFMLASLAAPASVTIGLAPSVSYSPSGILQTLASILSTQASYARRREEWQYQRGLATWDVRVADAGLDLASSGVDISEKEREISSLSVGLAADTVELLSQDQFRSGELYRWMQAELKRLHRDHLNLAVSTAAAAQRALAFELQEPLNFIGYQYWQPQREGLLGSERLQFDLERLEQHRLQRAERRREITKTISLARTMPSEFQRFRETGILEFATQQSWFDRDFPGHYLRLIKSVELSVLALTSPVHGISATLTNTGVSRVVAGPPWVDPKVLQRLPESVSLSAPIQTSGLFELRLDDPLLLPFEGSGVEATWVLEMGRGANRIDFSTLSDVLMTVRYTAKDDAGYRQRVIARLETGVQGRAFYGMAQSFPDSWYHFHNPRFLANPADYDDAQGRPRPYALRAALGRGSFPPNEDAIAITRVTLSAAQPVAFDIPVTLSFLPDGASTAISADGVIRRGTLVFPSEFRARAPYGAWTIAVRTDPLVAQRPDLQDGPDPVPAQKRIKTDWLQNLLLVVDYTAQVSYPRQ